MTSVIKKNSFNLVNFDSNNAPSVKIYGALSRIDDRLEIKYVLNNSSAIAIPQTNKAPLRRYDLWEHTCFEFFLRIKNTTKYWEFNLSPSGNWNVFRFLNYRSNIVEEKAFDALPFTVFQDVESLILDAKINLNKIVTADENLEVAIATVVEGKDGLLSYWALTHPATEADFHHQDSFTIEI